MKYNKWSEQVAERPTWQFMFVSIAIVLIGILYWHIFVFTVVVMDCSLPNTIWLGGDTALDTPFWLFAAILVLLLLWNAVLLFNKIYLYKKLGFVNKFLFTANTLAILMFANVMFEQFQFIGHYVGKYESVKHDRPLYFSKHIDSDLWRFYVEDTGKVCIDMAAFAGNWEIVDSKQGSKVRLKGVVNISSDSKISSSKSDWEGAVYRYTNIANASKESEHTSIIKYTYSETIIDAASLNYKNLLHEMPDGRKLNALIDVKENIPYEIRWNLYRQRSEWHIELKGDYMSLQFFERNYENYELNGYTDYVILKRIPDPFIQ